VLTSQSAAATGLFRVTNASAEAIVARMETIARDHGVLRAAQLANAIHDESLGAKAFDLRAHLSEQPAEVLHVRLARRVSQNRRAARGDGARWPVLRGAATGPGGRGRVGLAQQLGIAS